MDTLRQKAGKFRDWMVRKRSILSRGKGKWGGKREAQRQ